MVSVVTSTFQRVCNVVYESRNFVLSGKGVQIYMPVSISDIHGVLELGSGASGIFCLSSLSDTSKQGKRGKSVQLPSPCLDIERVSKTRQDNECRRAEVYPLCPHLHTIHAYHFILLRTKW